MNTLKPEAIRLRDAGYSYKMIHDALGIPMSTLSGWFRDKPYTPNAEARNRIETGKYAYGLRRRDERLQEIQELNVFGQTEIGHISTRDLWILGLGLWIGEGSKTIEQIRLANSDPRVIQLWVKWLYEICGMNAENIFVTLHIYPESNEEDCRAYWRSVIGGDIRFGKCQTDKRGGKAAIKAGKLPYGTAHVSVRALGDPEKGVRLYRRMMGWVSAILISADERV
jgi:hypothetical protein